jgi:hypothetical protein
LERQTLTTLLAMVVGQAQYKSEVKGEKTKRQKTKQKTQGTGTRPTTGGNFWACPKCVR